MAFGNKKAANPDFISVRGCSVSQTKAGNTMVGLFLSKEDLEKLSAKIGENANDDGVKINVILSKGNNKAGKEVDRASLTVGPNAAPGASSPATAPKKSFGFKPKAPIA